MSQWNDHAHVWAEPEPDSYCEDCGIDRLLAAEVDVLAGGSLTTNSPRPMAVTLQFDTPEDLVRLARSAGRARQDQSIGGQS